MLNNDGPRYLLAPHEEYKVKNLSLLILMSFQNCLVLFLKVHCNFFCLNFF